MPSHWPTIIAGTRGIISMRDLYDAIEASGFQITEVISGMADRSPDMLGIAWAKQHMVRIARFPAQWEDMRASWVIPAKRRDGRPYNKVAGLLRNQQMAEYASCEARGTGRGQLIALWDGGSPGTKDMIERAEHERLAVFVHKCAITPVDSDPSIDDIRVKQDGGRQVKVPRIYRPPTSTPWDE
jgi:hypothetical protein